MKTQQTDADAAARRLFRLCLVEGSLDEGASSGRRASRHRTPADRAA